MTARVVLADAQDVAAHVAERFVRLLARRPNAVLGLATGATPEPIYQRLAASYAAGLVSFRDAASFNLDEYIGLGPEHPASFAAFMRRHLFARTDLRRTDIPRGTAPDPAAEAVRYEQAIAASGGIDLQLLGIGGNGHVGFNEPGSDFASRTRLVRLTEATRDANRRFFADGAVPEQALTMGIGTILEAREIVLVATGSAKAHAVARMLQAPPGPDCPASALRSHPAVTVVCDNAAAMLLDR
jgi:glucosamine-6-phosphate deaminase